jgi:hypothetical protein
MSDSFSEAGVAAIVAAILLAQQGTVAPSEEDVAAAAASAARIMKATRVALQGDQPEPRRRSGFGSASYPNP